MKMLLTFALDVDLDAWATEYGLDPADAARVRSDAEQHVAVLVGDAVVATAERMGTFQVVTG